MNQSTLREPVFVKNLAVKVSLITVFVLAWHVAVAGNLNGIVKNNSGQPVRGVMNSSMTLGLRISYQWWRRWGIA